MTSQIFGYVRVSTSRLTTDQQIDALVAAGVPSANIFGDVRSGAKWDREGLESLKKMLRTGDTLVVVSLDRLGRSLGEMVKLLDWLVSSQISLRSLREGVDFSTPTGRMIAGVFASLGEYERELIKERTEAAREAARQRGRQIGRPRAMTPSQVEDARVLLSSGQSRAHVAEKLGVSRATLYRALPV